MSSACPTARESGFLDSIRGVSVSKPQLTCRRRAPCIGLDRRPPANSARGDAIVDRFQPRGLGRERVLAFDVRAAGATITAPILWSARDPQERVDRALQ